MKRPVTRQDRRDVAVPRAAPAVLCALLLCAAGCGGDSGSTPAPTAGSAPSSSSDALLPIALPELQRLEEPVRSQLREAHVRVKELEEGSGPRGHLLGAAYGELGKLFMAAGFGNLAEPCLLNAQALAPDERRWPYYLAHLYRTSGDAGRAETAFRRVVERWPDEAAAIIWLGEISLLDGRPAEAARLFTRALEAQPHSLAAQFGLGRAALAQREFHTAAAHLEEVLARYRSVVAHRVEAQSARTQSVNVHYPLALAYRGLSRMDRAEAHLKRRGDFEILPADPLIDELREVLRSAVSHEIRGTRALNNGDWKAASAEFEAGLALEPSSPVLRQKLGTAKFMAGDVAAAREAFETVVRESPGYARGHYSLGVLLESSGRQQEALARFSAAIAREPDYVEARLRLAELLRARGRLPEAAAHYDRALAIDPQIAEAALGRAITLIRLRRYPEARDRLQQDVQLITTQPWLTHALARLLAAAPDAGVRDGGRALALLQALPADAQRLDHGETMAMALAEVGRYDEAAEWQRRAVAAAREAGDAELARRRSERLRLYETGRPSRTPWRDDELQ